MLAIVLLAIVLLVGPACDPDAAREGAACDAPGDGVRLVVGSQGTGAGEFFKPRAIAVDRRDGRFYVIDRSGRIQLFGPEGGLLAAWSLPEFENGQPVGVTIEASGTLLVNDSHYQRILRYAPEGELLLASWGRGGTGPDAFVFGRDVAVDAAGRVYAGNYTAGADDRILKFTPHGKFITSWGGRGTAPGQFDRPQGMAIEPRGGAEFLLVADCNNHRIQRFALDGTFVSAWGTPGTSPGCLRFPMSVAVGPSGMIYVVEWGNNRVQRFDRDGNARGVWGRAGRESGELLTPWDIGVGPGERLHVVDYGNHRVQVFQWPDARLVAHRDQGGTDET